MSPVQLFATLSMLFLTSLALGTFENSSCAEKYPLRCPRGWRKRRESCYRLTPSLTRDAARRSCRQMGGEMATPDSQKQNDFFWRCVQELPEPGLGLWIDCNDEEQEGRFVCKGRDRHNVFDNWNPGEPNEKNGGEDCVALRIFDNGTWMDVSCHHPFRAICKWVPDSPRPYCFTTNIEGRLDKSCLHD